MIGEFKKGEGAKLLQMLNQPPSTEHFSEYAKFHTNDRKCFEICLNFEKIFRTP